jgi:HlyD family secretion protein
MLWSRRLMAVVTVSMITGAVLHALVRQPKAKAEAAAQTPPPREEQSDKGRGVAVLCRVVGGGLVLSMVPEGTTVKTGDLLCELDSSELRDHLTDREIVVKQTENESKLGQLAHQAALMALKEYQDGTYFQDKAAIAREIKRAESNLVMASDHMDGVTRLFEKGTVSKAQKVSAELAFQETKFALELAQGKLNTLENFTKPNTVKRLISEVERSRSQEMAANEILELRRAQAERTRQQVGHCRITAPCDGRVVYVAPPAGPAVHEGDRVHEQQRLLSVLPPHPE